MYILKWFYNKIYCQHDSVSYFKFSLLKYVTLYSSMKKWYSCLWTSICLSFDCKLLKDRIHVILILQSLLHILVPSMWMVSACRGRECMVSEVGSGWCQSSGVIQSSNNKNIQQLRNYNSRHCFYRSECDWQGPCTHGAYILMGGDRQYINKHIWK